MEPDEALQALDFTHRPLCELGIGRRTPGGYTITGPCQQPATHYDQLACATHGDPKWHYVCDDHHTAIVLGERGIVCRCGRPITIRAARPL